MTPWINAGTYYNGFDPRKVEAGYAEKSGGRVTYIGDMAILRYRGKSISQQLSIFPYSIFWQEKILNPAHSHYFALGFAHATSSEVMITDGSSVTKIDWPGVMHPETGEIIFSRWERDHRYCQDRSLFVDGGPDDHGRIGGTGIPVKLRVVGDRLVVHEIGEMEADQ